MWLGPVARVSTQRQLADPVTAPAREPGEPAPLAGLGTRAS
jgi:hypothetical protein